MRDYCDYCHKLIALAEGRVVKFKKSWHTDCYRDKLKKELAELRTHQQGLAKVKKDVLSHY